MKVAREETFGPVAPLFRFETEDEVIAMANDTEFRLGCLFLHRELQPHMARRGGSGIWNGWHNTGMISNEVAPFGGVKQSGLGREGSHFGID